MEIKEKLKTICTSTFGFLKKLPLRIKLIAVVAIAIIVGIIVLIPNSGTSDESTLTTVSESSLKEVLEINELNTVVYDYNAVAQCKDKDGNIKYHVAYEGQVTAGIDFKKISTSIDNENKRITITVPAVEIQNRAVKIESLEFIFTNEKYNTETVSQEAYKLCLENLEEQTSKTTLIQDSAKANAMAAVEALFKPWIDSIDPQYTVDIVYGG